MSTEINPFTKGVYRRSGVRPCRVWASGDYSNPRGNFCRACVMTYHFGGYQDEYPSLDALVKDMAKQSNLSEQFV
eukprot:7197823-Alexandrium_andersonii.AAC.1